MKPTIANLRKIAESLTDRHELSMLKDNIAFYVSGAKAAALHLGKSVNDIHWVVLDEARAAEAFINARIDALASR
jgi:hypothetical protein